MLEPLNLLQGADLREQRNNSPPAVSQNILRNKLVGSLLPDYIRNIVRELTQSVHMADNTTATGRAWRWVGRTGSG